MIILWSWSSSLPKKKWWCLLTSFADTLNLALKGPSMVSINRRTEISSIKSLPPTKQLPSKSNSIYRLTMLFGIPHTFGSNDCGIFSTGFMKFCIIIVFSFSSGRFAYQLWQFTVDTIRLLCSDLRGCCKLTFTARHRSFFLEIGNGCSVGKKDQKTLLQSYP